MPSRANVDVQHAGLHPWSKGGLNPAIPLAMITTSHWNLPPSSRMALRSNRSWNIRKHQQSGPCAVLACSSNLESKTAIWVCNPLVLGNLARTLLKKTIRVLCLVLRSWRALQRPTMQVGIITTVYKVHPTRSHPKSHNNNAGGWVQQMRQHLHRIAESQAGNTHIASGHFPVL